MAYFLEYMESTAESKKIHFSEEILDNCRLVYRLNHDKNVWEFYAFWDSEVHYDDDDIIVPVQSGLSGTVEVDKNTPFVNVIGSTRDPRPKIYKSWIDVIRQAYNLTGGKYNPEICCTDGKYYDPCTHGEIQGGTCHNNSIVGGHVLIDTMTPRSVEEGSYVYLLPICNNHNTSKYNPQSRNWDRNVNTGTVYYMKTACDTLAIQLCKYMQRACVDRYINKYGLENIKKI